MQTPHENILFCWGILLSLTDFPDETPKFETLDVFREYQKKASEIVSNQKLCSKMPHDDVDYLTKRSKKYTSLLDAFAGSFQSGKNKKVFRAKVEKLYGMTKQQLSEVKQMANSVKFDSRKLNRLFKQAGLDMVSCKFVAMCLKHHGFQHQCAYLYWCRGKLRAF